MQFYKGDASIVALEMGFLADACLLSLQYICKLNRLPLNQRPRLCHGAYPLAPRCHLHRVLQVRILLS